MEFIAQVFNHTNYKIITTVLPFNIIDKNSEVLVYGKSKGGYQREPDKKHYTKIKTYIKSNDYVFPTSIILGIEEDKLEKILYEKDGVSYLKFTSSEQPIFRIVDGQHRILGIKESIEFDKNINKLPLSVNIICTPTNRKSIEMEIFGIINSKGKRLRTDLIELAKYDYRLIEENIGFKDINSHIGINVAYSLNENLAIENVWQNSIKIGIHEEQKIGIISVIAFKESITSIINYYLNYNQEYKNLDGDDLIKFTRISSKEIADFLVNAWVIISQKWDKCFNEIDHQYDFDSEFKSFRYNSNYYIQKTIGVKSINYLLGDIIKHKYNSIFNTKSLKDFEEVIYNSKLIDKDWLLGKTLSGYSSESGFGKVSQIIRNEIEFIRKD